MNLYPLKFDPILKERLWGGTKLRDVLGKNISSENIGESWELSGVKGDVSIVSNGALKGTSLQELIDSQGKKLLGKDVLDRFGDDFPILIKFIDANKDLSIQVHPNDELARKRHDSFGKTEMWYVMDADVDAELIVGFNRTIEKESYNKSLENNTLLELLNYEKVGKGDTFFIDTGKIHAIGAGILLAEIQQTSDITYRVFDFNRRDNEGKLRQLHTEQALDAIDYERKDDFKVAYGKAKNGNNKMVHCPYFKTDFLHLTQDFEQDVSKRDSFTIYICVEGEAVVSNDWGKATLKKGETLLLPACSSNCSISTRGTKLLEVTI